MIIQVAIVIFVYVTILFVIAHFMEDNTIADIFWGPGFVVIAAFTLMQAPGWDVRKMVVSILVLLWGVRLAFHILLRKKGQGENFRYLQWRETWKYFKIKSYLRIFLLQGLFMLIISAPVWFIDSMPNAPLTFWDHIGLIVFGIGFFIEVTADSQLIRYKKDPAFKGKLINKGLWGISRHPNYFGEALLWWGISLYAVSLPWGWITLISPLFLTILLRFVTGVPVMDKRLQRFPGWDEYKQQTAPFVPFAKFL
ncbi:MAG TPA: DUF1295 domain-containing protein [Bacteroidales bacterium]|nr:DUF1295 domain-containing protein [Bacteroidales bacterium]HPS72698.1 DUF1295 domain-containing protein [Bacteroidales bacterium]